MDSLSFGIAVIRGRGGISVRDAMTAFNVNIVLLIVCSQPVKRSRDDVFDDAEERRRPSQRWSIVRPRQAAL